MDARREKAHDLADRASIRLVDGCYLVPSQTGNRLYTVILDKRDAACDCPDFDLRDKPCKHILAVRLWLRRQRRGVGQDTDTRPAPKKSRPTYPQAWDRYNAAQTNERRHFMAFLADLCRGIPQPPPKSGPGRRPIPIADAVYSACFKVYSTLSARRFNGDLEEAHERGHVGCVPHFNSVLNCLDNPAVTPILTDLIRRSSLPLREVETAFAIDSSGFSASKFSRWFNTKYGITRDEGDWIKAHVATGVRTNVITAAVVLDKNSADVTQFPPLLEATAQGFKIGEVSADKAYAAAECFDVVDKHGGTLFAAFKSNATGGIGGTYQKMFHYFCLKRDEFLRHYHQRSNIESTFSMLKRKFGDAVRSKTDTAMRNEVLAKIVCHNVCCLISALYELGIAPTFDDCTNKETPAHIIRFPGA
jgi:Transposase DDE domain/SWIM zinc finger